MCQLSSSIMWAVCGVIFLSSFGCGKNGPKPDNTAATYSERKEEAKKSRLKDIATIYLAYLNKNPGKPARSLEDFKPFAIKYPEAMQGIKEGRYVVCWNLRMPGDAQKIIAYEADVPTKGGFVVDLLQNVEMMTAAEFRTANLAGQ